MKNFLYGEWVGSAGVLDVGFCDGAVSGSVSRQLMALSML